VHYNDEMLQDIINEIFWKQLTKHNKDLYLNGNNDAHNNNNNNNNNNDNNNDNDNDVDNKNVEKICSKYKLTLEEMSIRTPPMFWSFFHNFPFANLKK